MPYHLECAVLNTLAWYIQRSKGNG
jgi:hypothetical protein